MNFMVSGIQESICASYFQRSVAVKLRHEYLRTWKDCFSAYGSKKAIRYMDNCTVDECTILDPKCRTFVSIWIDDHKMCYRSIGTFGGFIRNTHHWIIECGFINDMLLRLYCNIRWVNPRNRAASNWSNCFELVASMGFELCKYFLR